MILNTPFFSIGMAENMWPLPLRVKSDLFIGMKFDESKALNGRFSYESTSDDQAVAASTYRPHHALSSGKTLEPNLFSSDGADTTDGFVLDNPDGILRDFSSLEAVVQSFLKEEVLDPSRSSGLEQMMISLNVVALDQWSMITITDNNAPSNNSSSGRRRRNLRGLDENAAQSASTNSKLRGTKVDSRRELVMREPQQVFHFQVYSTYSSRANSDMTSIIKTIKDFGGVIEHSINANLDSLIADVQKRTGLNGPECIVISGNETGSETLDEETYSVINFGSDTQSKSLPCRDRLPLYYHDLNELESRGVTNHNASLYEKVKLGLALDLLKEASQSSNVYSTEEEPNPTGSSLWIYVALR